MLDDRADSASDLRDSLAFAPIQTRMMFVCNFRGRLRLNSWSDSDGGRLLIGTSLRLEFYVLELRERNNF